MSSLTITQLTVNRSKLLLRIILAGILLPCLMIFGGCKGRQLVRSTPQMDIEPRFWVRVLLVDETRTCSLKITSPFYVSDGVPQVQRIIHFDRVDVPINVSISSGKIAVAGQPFTSNEIIISPDEPHIFNLNGDDYRGKLKLIVAADGESFDAINLVPPEPYLAGVIGAEMPDYWELAALQAQAIAARTYCLYIKEHFGSGRTWDVRKTAANQVYLGVGAESAQVWNAVNRTYGRVLVCRHPDGTEGLFPTYYSSTCGGHTENSKHVFGDSFEPLVGVACPYCKDVAKIDIFFWPMIQFDKTYVTTRLLQKYPKLKQLGEITDISPAGQSNYQTDYGKFSRLTSVKLLGSTGKSDFLRAEDFRLSIDPSGWKLRSTICRIINMGEKWAFSAGRGWGHGVGMCQCGAQGMARQGKTAEQILSYYYPGSWIERVY